MHTCCTYCSSNRHSLCDVRVCVCTYMYVCYVLCSVQGGRLSSEERRPSEFLTEADLEKNVSIVMD